MSVFAEPLAQVRAYIKLRRITRARSEALAALDLIEQRAGEMEERVRDALDVLTGFSRPMNNAERISFTTSILEAALSAREEAR